MPKDCNSVQQKQHHLLSRKLDKGSSNKLLCVYRCAARGEILLRSLKKKKKKKNFFLKFKFFIKKNYFKKKKN